jgi:hypothetical protein
MSLLHGELASAALACLGEVVRDSEAPTGARVDAARTILDRAGFITARAATVPVLPGAGALDLDGLRQFIEAGNRALMRRQAAAGAVPAVEVVQADNDA